MLGKAAACWEGWREALGGSSFCRELQDIIPERQQEKFREIAKRDNCKAPPVEASDRGDCSAPLPAGKEGKQAAAAGIPKVP